MSTTKKNPSNRIQTARSESAQPKLNPNFLSPSSDAKELVQYTRNFPSSNPIKTARPDLLSFVERIPMTQNPGAPNIQHRLDLLRSRDDQITNKENVEGHLIAEIERLKEETEFKDLEIKKLREKIGELEKNDSAVEVVKASVHSYIGTPMKEKEAKELAKRLARERIQAEAEAEEWRRKYKELEKKLETTSEIPSKKQPDNTLQQKVLDLESKILSLNNESDKLKSVVKERNTEIDNLKARIGNKDREIDEIRAELRKSTDKLPQDSKIKDLLSQIDLWKNKATLLEDMLSKEQKRSKDLQDSRDKIESDLKNAKEDLEKARKLFPKLEATTLELERFRQENEILKKNLNETEPKIKFLTLEIESLKTELEHEKTKKGNLDEKELEIWHQRIDDLELEWGEKYRLLEIELDEKENNFDNFKEKDQEIFKLKEKIRELQEINQKQIENLRIDSLIRTVLMGCCLESELYKEKEIEQPVIERYERDKKTIQVINENEEILKNKIRDLEIQLVIRNEKINELELKSTESPRVIKNDDEVIYWKNKFFDLETKQSINTQLEDELNYWKIKVQELENQLKESKPDYNSQLIYYEQRLQALENELASKSRESYKLNELEENLNYYKELSFELQEKLKIQNSFSPNKSPSEDLHIQLDQYKMTIDSLYNQIDSLNLQINQQNDNQIKFELSDLRSRFYKIQDENIEFKNIISNLEFELKNKVNIVQNDYELIDLRNRLYKLQDENVDLKNINTNLEFEIKNTKQLLKESQLSLEQRHFAGGMHLEQQNYELEKLKKEVEYWQNLYRNNEIDKTKNESLKKSTVLIQQDSDRLLESLALKAREIADLNDKIIEKSRQNEETQVKLRLSESQIRSLEGKIHGLAEEIEAWKSKYSLLETLKMHEGEEIRQHSEAVRRSQMDREIRDLTLHYESEKMRLEGEIIKNNSIIDNYKRENVLWRDKCNDLEGKIWEIRESFEQERKDIENRKEITKRAGNMQESRIFNEKAKILERENDDLKAKIRILEGLNFDINVIELKKKDLEEKNIILISDNDRKATRIAELISENRKLDEDNRKLIDNSKEKIIDYSLIEKFQKQRIEELEELKHHFEILKENTLSNQESIEFQAERIAYQTVINQLKIRVEDLTEEQRQIELSSNKKVNFSFSPNKNDKNIVEIDSIKLENRNLKEQLIRVESDNRELQAQIEQISLSIEFLQNEREKTWQLLEERKNEREDLIQSIEELKSRLNKNDEYDNIYIRQELEEMRISKENYKNQAERNYNEMTTKNLELIAKIEELENVKFKYQESMTNIHRLESKLIEKLQQEEIYIA